MFYFAVVLFLVSAKAETFSETTGNEVIFTLRNPHAMGSNAFASSTGSKSDHLDPLEFFGIGSRDASDVTWAHAVNNQMKLFDALNSSLMMLEADVSLKPGPNGSLIPFMAHSSNDASDITLEEWITQVCQDGRKGIKLDFKSIDVVPPSLTILKKYEQQIKVPLWLNADIIGRGPATKVGFGVDPKQFFSSCQIFPQSILSIGWVTNCPLVTCGRAKYTWTNVKDIFEAITDYSTTLNSTQPITFPVRAAFVLRSVSQFQWLLDMVPRPATTFTVWTNIADILYTRVDDLLKFRTFFPSERIYYDLLDAMAKDFHARKHSFPPNSIERGYTLPDLIIPFSLNTTSGNYFMGSRSILLENKTGFRTAGQPFVSQTEKVEIKMDFSFGRISTFNDTLSVCLRCSHNSPSGLRLLISTSGIVTLEEGFFSGNSSQTIKNNLLESQWVGKLLGMQQVSISSISPEINVQVVDNVANNTATFTITTALQPFVVFTGTFPASSLSRTSETYIPTMVFYEGGPGSFAAIETFRFDLFSRNQ